MNILLSLIGLLYIVVVSAICHILPIPEIVKSFLSLPSLLIIPYSVGTTVAIILKKILKSTNLKLNRISEYIFFWFLGFWFMMLIFVLLALFHQYTYLFIQPYLIILATILIGIIYHLYNRYKIGYKKDDLKNIINSLRGIIPIIVSLLIGISLGIFSKYFVKFQTIFRGWMIPSTIYAEVLKIEDKIYILSPAAKRITDVILIYLGSAIFNIDPLSIIWSISFFILVIFSIGSYLFAYEISKNKALSILYVLFVALLHSNSRWILSHGLGLDFRGSVLIFTVLPGLLFFIHKVIIVKYNTTKDAVIISIKIFTLSIFFFIALNMHIILSQQTTFNNNIFNLLVLSSFILIIIIYIIFQNKFHFRDTVTILIFIPIMCFLYFSHFYDAFIVITGICIYIVINILFKKVFNQNEISYLKIKYLIFFILIGTFLFIYLQKIGFLNLINLPQLSNLLFRNLYKDITFDYKYTVFWKFYDPFVICFLILSSILLTQKKYDYNSLIMIFMVLLIFLGYFSQEKMSLKIFKLAYIFIAYILASSPLLMFDIYKKKSEKQRIYSKLICSFVIIIILFLLLLHPIYKGILSIPISDDKGHHSMINENEYFAGKWIKNNTPENTVIISDYYSILILSALSNRVVLIDPRISLNEITQESKSLLWYIKEEIFLANDSKTIYKNIYNLPDEPIHITHRTYSKNKFFTTYNYIVVIDNRTSKWIAQKDISGVAFTHYGQKVDINHLKNFENNTYFTSLYKKDNYLYIFGVNPKPGIPFKIVNNSKS